MSLSFFPDTYNSIQTNLIPSLSMPRFYLAADLLSHGCEIKSGHGKAGYEASTNHILYSGSVHHVRQEKGSRGRPRSCERHVHVTLATLMVCCSIASWMLALSCSRILLNSSERAGEKKRIIM